MNEVNHAINTGPLIGCKWLGHWTPYAEAIAENYENWWPWFSTVTVNLGNPPDFLTQFTEMQKDDVLIFGAQAVLNDFPFYFLQITHEQTGIPWVAPNIVPFAPVTAYAGVNSAGPAKFPEVFFYPKNTRLRLDWSTIDPSAPNLDPCTFTFIGVQLTGPKGGQAPQEVPMPDGSITRVGSRIPLFLTIGAGARTVGSQIFTFANNSQAVQYMPGLDCDVEIHDASLNFFFGYQSFITNLRLKYVAMGIESGWTPSFSPFMSFYGRPGADYPNLPFCKPWILPAAHRQQINMINPNDAAPLNNGLLTIRGVRKCFY